MKDRFSIYGYWVVNNPKSKIIFAGSKKYYG
jgi:hypothetical protein